MLMDKERGREILLEVAGVLDYWRVPFFLIQGTCLGAVRDKGFVPHEKDIDIGILQEHMGSIPVSAIVQRGYDIELFTTPFNRIRTVVLWKDNVKVDLVGFTEWTLITNCMGEMSIGKRVRFTASPVRHWIDKPYAIVHDANLLERYVTIEMFGRQWNVPHDYTHYLLMEYGTDWRKPKDDHVSRTRIYDFLKREGIPNDYLDER